MRIFAAVLLVAALSCSSPLGPLVDGKPYALTTINGEPLPWTSPLGSQPIAVGWIKLLSTHVAERHEEIGTVDGGTYATWTYTGHYTLRFGVLIVDYRPIGPGGGGPLHPVDTFYVSGNGLVMRETGYIAPLDSIVRYYARP
jgi:hypothetical protein